MRIKQPQPTLKFKPGDKSIVIHMVEKVNATMKRNDLCKYKSLSMVVIQYKSPDGHFPPHLDHCNNSFVHLMSLGCTASFMVKGPTMDEKREFEFHSGDMLVFNASTEAAVLHSVQSIGGSESCPSSLRKAFPVLQNHRYGVQCRSHF